MAFELECNLLRRNRYDLKIKARAYESQRSYYEVALAELGVTRTPSEVLDTDLVYFLVRNFNDLGVRDFYSELTGIPHILEIDYLKYRYRLLDRSDFKDTLSIIIKYLECRYILKGIYDYEREIHVIPRLTNKLSEVNLRYRDKPSEDGWYDARNLANIDSVYNSLYGEADSVLSIAGIYYKHFSRITGFVEDGNWTFFSGLTRYQELTYLKYVMLGKIRPTNIPEDYFDKYIEYLVQGNKVYEDLSPYIQEDLQIAIRKLEKKDVYIKAITPYGIYYFDKNKEYEYKTVVTFYCLDHDKNEMLPLGNQLNGFGGEYSSDILKSMDGVPYTLTGYSGKRKMYRVANSTRARYYDLKFKYSTGMLGAMYRNKKITGMVEVTKDNKYKLRKELGKIFS